jgi:hypothetical protein
VHHGDNIMRTRAILTTVALLAADALVGSLAGQARLPPDAPAQDEPHAGKPKMATETPPAVTVPDSIETRLRTLRFTDGFRDDATVPKADGNLDFQRGVRAFVTPMPAASFSAMRKGIRSFGSDSGTVLIAECLSDSRSLVLTATTESVYAVAWLDLTTRPVVVAGPSNTAGTPANFTGQKTSWHGFDRFDFLMDEAALTLRPIMASPEEKTGIVGQVKGQVRCVVVVPKKAAPGKPWSWRGRYFDHEPQAEIELLKRGFHIGFIQSDPGKQWDAWYSFLTEKHGLSKTPAFIGMSGGGRNAFTWATVNPDKVACIYADNPLITRASLMKLGELAQRDVPLLHICGSLDPLLGDHTLPVESIYQQLGGRISVMIKDGAGHHPHSLRDPTLIADFIGRSLKPASGASPAIAAKKFTKSSFYGVENYYSDFPKEGMYITCRGPLFSDSYARYEFQPDSTTGTVAVIAPKIAAPGKPWVFRADFVTRDAVVDLALLHQGFHIVTGPGPTDTNGTDLQRWNTVYKYLIRKGFSAKPCMEGAGRAAGQAYAWAIANPDKVSCIYAENPVLRSNMSKRQPLDNLAPLAKAGVHLLHVCGSLDPWLKSQTRVVEKRYQQLGGRIAVIIKDGEGHYPLAPKEVPPVVDFILKRVAAAARPSSE